MLPPNSAKTAYDEVNRSIAVLGEFGEMVLKPPITKIPA